MHEMSVVIEMVKIAEQKAKEEKVNKVRKLVLQIGELSALIPELVEACYPAAVYKTLLEGSELQIDIIPANAICQKCKKVFNVKEANYVCPNCSSEEWELLCGREIIIKEIQVC